MFQHKKNSYIKIGVMALAILSLFSSTLSVQAVDDVTPVSSEISSQNYESLKKSYQEKVSEYQDLKDSYSSIRKRYQNNPNSNLNERLLQQVRSYFPNSIETMISYLETAQEKVESSTVLTDSTRQELLAEIENDINFLTKQKSAFQNASDLESARKAANEIKNYWSKNRARAKKWSCRLMKSKAVHLKGKLNNTAGELESLVKQLEEEGQDVAQLESILKEAKAHLNSAEENIETAAAHCQQMNTFSQAQQSFQHAHGEIREIKNSLKQARQTMHKLIQELKKYRHRLKKVSGSGSIHLEGNGKTAVVGKGTVEGTLNNPGTLIVLDRGGDLTVGTNSQAEDEQLAENKQRYTQVTNFTLTGSDLVAVITSSEMIIDASGTGTVLFKGQGNYYFGDNTDQPHPLPVGGLEASLK